MPLSSSLSFGLRSALPDLAALAATPAVFAKLAVVPAMFALLLLAERRWPWRPPARGRALGNYGLAALNAAIPVLLPAVSITVAALWAAEHRAGLFHQLAWPPLLEGLLAFLTLDLAVYAQHRALHAVPWLWPLHRVHHTDAAMDVSTGLRFHPIEALASAAYKTGITVLVGASVAAAASFAVALTLGSLFSHANLRLPPRTQRWLDWLLVTPAMHRVHHSVRLAESQSNYGFFLPWWDRLFGSYRAASVDGDALTLGQDDRQGDATRRFAALLAEPLPVPLRRRFQSRRNPAH